MQVNDLVEDREGDKAVVRELDGDYVFIEWDCNPGSYTRIHASLLFNVSDRVRELDAKPPYDVTRDSMFWS